MRLVILFLLLASQCIGQEIAFEDIEIDEKGFIVLDFGQVEQKTKPKVSATLVNVGDKPLIISRFTTSCGCTVPYITERILEPGGKTTIQISWIARLGDFRSSGKIESNATNHSMLWIRLEGEGIE
ncbi:MAG: DUF1573 domain-containing protein [Aureispira sp.]|nr:DUF1573 domain-containing protein [Aureispira sp.]